MKKGSPTDQERTCPQLGKSRERRIDLVFSAGIQDMDCMPEVRAAARGSSSWIGNRTVGFTEHAITLEFGYQLVQQFQSFAATRVR